MKNILEEIYEHKLVEVRNRKKSKSVSEICKEIKCLEKPKDFFSALKNKSEKKETALICEVKKGSPSAGLIRKNFDHLAIAKIYEESGASCISVLTDEKYFLGKGEYLKEIRSASSLPLLRKDFMVDCYQVYEAKALGADCILLIVAMLDDQKLQEIESCAFDLGLSVLIEIHNEEELQRASKLKSRLLGINNRNLKTLQVDLETSLHLSKQISPDSNYVLVAESGIKNSQNIKILKEAGINCFLIGEHFMRQEDISSAVKNFLV